MPKGIKGFQKGHKVSKETRIKIGNANRRPYYFICDYCGKESITKLSAYNRKKRHFCSRECYMKFVKEKLNFEEKNAYKGIRKTGQSKQVYHQNYCKKNPKRIAHLKARRYAREKGAVGKHTLQEWENLLAEFDYKCAFCRKKKELTKDHIIPLSEGGTDYIDNIQPLCRSCNSRKWKHIYENPELLEAK
jgi:5-methylcytosine-specific restriction endonuclease McrA